ncbi:MAG TPA: peptide-N-glycosidase F-related protein [Bacteroidia bacterium]|jgi:hypothetical protein|nr:peptide-N-glycosidase F-related protein [Bacteroidia bacterium]
MKKIIFLALLSISSLKISANAGDTTIVNSHTAAHWNWYGSIDNWAVFPDTSHHYRKIILKYKLGCPSGGCSAWDYTTQIFVKRHTGIYDSTLSYSPYFTVNGNADDSVLFNTTATYNHYYDTANAVTDSTISTPLMIVQYLDSLNPTVPTDTLWVYPAGYYNYIWNASGNIVDSVYVNNDSLWHNGQYDIYTPYEVIDPIEIARYITPYGGNLTSTWNNTWYFDVTDYAPILHDSVDMRAFYSGWSDGYTITLDFEMIEGVPPRTPIRVENLWSGYYGYGNPSNSIENYLTPKTVYIAPNELNSNVRFDITGHGFGGTEDCSEFCPKMYYMKFDNVTRYSKLVWRDKCGLNANSAQPGTWLYDRANWCPGEQVHVFENELTPYVTPGDSVTIDADMETFTNLDLSHGAGYQVDGQLITYSAPNFTLDAEMREILAPNSEFNLHRMNSICDKPVVVIRNVGSTPLTSLTIDYGVVGAPSSTYTWTGNLPFLAVDTVTLPTVNWYGTAAKFYATVSSPNGNADQYADNNSLQVNYVAPLMHIPDLVVEARTNLDGSETSYSLADASGNVIVSRSNLAASTTYRDTVHLQPGCYILKCEDAGKDGLSFWANNSGAGYFRLKNPATGMLVKSFNPDFGTEIFYEFTVGINIGMEEEPVGNYLIAYPNPTDNILNIDLQTPEETSELLIFDYQGRIIHDEKVEGSSVLKNIQVDLSDYAPGMYVVQLRSASGIETRKIIRN